MTTDEILAWMDENALMCRHKERVADGAELHDKAFMCCGSAVALEFAADHIRATIAAESQRDTSGQTSAGDGAGE